MNLFVPPYYSDFICKAGDCRHNCCIGWEIDVDAITCARYLAEEGEIGIRLKNNLLFEDDGTASFRLDGEDRCPFLNKSGLCDLILHKSERYLCDICTLHPRFRNEFAGRIEVGLGFCCEEAVRLALSYPKCPIPIPSPPIPRITEEEEPFDAEQTDFEAALLSLRDSLLIRLYDSESSLSVALDSFADQIGVSLPNLPIAQWGEIFSALNRMDSAWDNHLARLSRRQEKLSEVSLDGYESDLRAFAAYLLFRHLPQARFDGMITERILFVVLAVRFIAAMQIPPIDAATRAEQIRLFSAEIEYDTENTDALLSMLTRYMEYTEE